LFRPYDDQSQDRIRREAEAVLAILGRIESGEWIWIVSEALAMEVAQVPDEHLRERIETLIARARSNVLLDDALLERGSFLERHGFGMLDALHLACAEVGLVDVLLTTDDRLIKAADRLGDGCTVRVANPWKWLEDEVDP
jgi:predicted nucleic acid-binding protein